MTADELIAEGRQLARPCFFLRPQGSGPVAAIWWENDEEEIRRTGFSCLISIDAGQLPEPQGLDGFINVFTNEQNGVEITRNFPKRKGINLFASPASILPPIEVVFSRGSKSVGEWLLANRWPRDWDYNDNFPDNPIAAAYQDAYMSEHPLNLNSEIFAVMGGWHFQFPDTDWKSLLDDQLIVMTLQDSEPWVEAWRSKTGEFKVIQRIT